MTREKDFKKISGEALRLAFVRTAPVMVGYLFLGAAYGILMAVNGFGIGWAMAMSIFVYAGSLQYVGVNLLVAGASPIAAFLMALMVNARHLFYGISMLGKYREMGKIKPYLIFGLTDETFSVVCGDMPLGGVSKRQYFFWVTLLDQLYWVAGTLLGGAFGSLFSFNTKGLDFALTALFVVIFTEQWLGQKDHKPAVTGVVCSVICLLFFGAQAFIVPAMALILLVVSLRYKKEWNKGEKEI